MICQDRYTDVCHKADEHWIYYAELMKTAIDSNKEGKTISKEECNLVGLDDSFPNKPQG